MIYTIKGGIEIHLTDANDEKAKKRFGIVYRPEDTLKSAHLDLKAGVPGAYPKRHNIIIAYKKELTYRFMLQGVQGIRNKHLTKALLNADWDFDGAFDYGMNIIFTPLFRKVAERKSILSELKTLNQNMSSIQTSMKEGYSDASGDLDLEEQISQKAFLEEQIKCMKRRYCCVRDEGNDMIKLSLIDRLNENRVSGWDYEDMMHSLECSYYWNVDKTFHYLLGKHTPATGA